MTTKSEQGVARILGAKIVSGDASNAETPETAKVIVGSKGATADAFEAKLNETLNAK